MNEIECDIDEYESDIDDSDKNSDGLKEQNEDFETEIYKMMTCWIYLKNLQILPACLKDTLHPAKLKIKIWIFADYIQIYEKCENDF